MVHGPLPKIDNGHIDSKQEGKTTMMMRAEQANSPNGRVARNSNSFLLNPYSKTNSLVLKH